MAEFSKVGCDPMQVNCAPPPTLTSNQLQITTGPEALGDPIALFQAMLVWQPILLASMGLRTACKRIRRQLYFQCNFLFVLKSFFDTSVGHSESLGGNRVGH